MVKLVFCLRRREGMGLEELPRYWRDTHAPLVQQHTVALFEDEQRFIDHAHSPIFLAEEHEVLAPITGGGAMDAETAWDEP
jgi:hypothetical protein